MNRSSDPKLRIVLMTRTGRPSGEKILKGLIRADKRCVGVVAERRSRMLFNHGLIAFLTDSIKKHGVTFILTRAVEMLKTPFCTRRKHLADYCREYRIPFYLVDNHNSDASRRILMNCKPDVLITANTRIISPGIIRIAAKAALNFHTSKLPRYAGLDSIFWALYHGEKEIGVSIHYLEEGLDTGDIVTQETIAIQPGDNLDTLTEKAHNLGARLAAAAIDKFERGDFSGIPQDNALRTYFSWPTPAQRRKLRRLMRLGTHG